MTRRHLAPCQGASGGSLTSQQALRDPAAAPIHLSTLPAPPPSGTPYCCSIPQLGYACITLSVPSGTCYQYPRHACGCAPSLVTFRCVFPPRPRSVPSHLSPVEWFAGWSRSPSTSGHAWAFVRCPRRRWGGEFKVCLPSWSPRPRLRVPPWSPPSVARTRTLPPRPHGMERLRRRGPCPHACAAAAIG